MRTLAGARSLVKQHKISPQVMLARFNSYMQLSHSYLQEKRIIYFSSNSFSRQTHLGDNDHTSQFIALSAIAVCHLS